MLSDPAIADAYREACLAELRAPKPGNVHDFAPGHRMESADFERSAAVSAPFIAARGASIGERVHAAVAATLEAVGTNTNLGIVLLCAPLARAAETGEALGSVLANLTVEDARLVFRAIALAAPAGLGKAEAHDVHGPIEATLLNAMRAAAGRDRIANAYVTEFAEIFGTGLPALRAARQPPAWHGTVAAYFAFLTSAPDSHIGRKWGTQAAVAVMEEARCESAALELADPLLRLLAFDASLKARGLNPGTCADLTVATLFADRLAEHLRIA